MTRNRKGNRKKKSSRSRSGVPTGEFNDNGVPYTLLINFTRYEREAVTLLYNLHAYLLNNGVDVNGGFRFDDEADLESFKQHFWGDPLRPIAWMSRSFSGFKIQLGKCKFIHDDGVEELKLTWINPYYTRVDPDYEAIMTDKRSGIASYVLADGDHPLVTPRAVDEEVGADEAGPSDALMPLSPATVLNNLVEKLAVMQERSKALAGCKAMSQTLRRNLKAQDHDLNIVKEQIHGLGKHLSASQQSQTLAMAVEGLLLKGVRAPSVPVKKAVIEIHSPLVGELTDGSHLSSIFLGDTIARILKFSKVEALIKNNIVDCGPHVGMVVERLLDIYPDWNKAGVQAIDNLLLQNLYEEGKAAYVDDKNFNNRAKRASIQIKNLVGRYLEAWEKVLEVSQYELNQICMLLGVTVEESVASAFEPYIDDVLVESSLDDLISIGEGGSRVIFVEGQECPLTIMESDGTYVYQTLTDFLSLWTRFQEEKAEWVIYVGDDSKSEHFRSLFTVAKQAGWLPTGSNRKACHVPFGLSQGGEEDIDSGSIFQLLCQAREECKDVIRKRGKSTELSLNEIEAIAFGAVRYGHMRRFPLSFAELFNDQGNTGFNIQYLYARIVTIVSESGEPIEELKMKGNVTLGLVEEHHLARLLLQFTAVVSEACLRPTKLWDYLDELCIQFQLFEAGGFANESTSSEQKHSRLLLCEATTLVMKQCFNLLGIEPVDKLF